MADPRQQKLAQVLVHYSLALKPGDKFIIFGPAFAAPLIYEVYREAVRVGAHVTTKISLEGLQEVFFQEANDEQLAYVSEIDTLEVEHYDAELTIWGSENTKLLSGIDPKRIAKRREARAQLSKRSLERMGKGETRWCGTMFPTNAHAHDAYGIGCVAPRIRRVERVRAALGYGL